MYPVLFEIPGLGLPIRSYPFMILLGMFAALFTARRRAKRVGLDDDPIPTMLVLAALAGIIGCRIMYVLHYWQRDFAHLANPIAAIFNLQYGGAELLGGVILAILVLLIYLRIRRLPILHYFDILAPSMLLAQGFGRIGCFLFGCCWGGPCPADLPWAVQFPYASPPFRAQWEEEQLKVPDDLLVKYSDSTELYPREFLMLHEPDYHRILQQARRSLEKRDPTTIDPADLRLQMAEKTLAMNSALNPLTPDQDNFAALGPKQQLVRQYHSHPIHPVQLYSALGAFLLAWLLAEIFRRRTRPGTVFLWFMVLYSAGRIVLEQIRTEPRHWLGFSASSLIALAMLLIGSTLLLRRHYHTTRPPVPPS
ncbi:MAG: Prolipoprotein diacylglyceryl transferase [Phycisphaerae bacterium]|nr:Prolipoprotein diacylglyceryl transferase [Phycisphaerae bacterium]